MLFPNKVINALWMLVFPDVIRPLFLYQTCLAFDLMQKRSGWSAKSNGIFSAEVGRQVTNGTTLGDLLPPDRLQKFADNVTNVLLPDTPDLDLEKFMGRWFEGINSPRASEQRCVVHHCQFCNILCKKSSESFSKRQWSLESLNEIGRGSRTSKDLRDKVAEMFE